MTTLFISHGAPTLAIKPGETGKLLASLAESLPRPDAILVVSAHWDTAIATVSNAKSPDTIHDFGGFPKAMHDIQYATKGSPMLASKTAGLLAAAGIPVQQENRGLDHGAWVPLMLMFPDADIAVTQLSIQNAQTPEAHYALGKAIGVLQDDNMMIVCSGAITHNLQDFFSPQIDAQALDYVSKFADWMGEKIVVNDINALINYRTQNQYGVQAHPSEDHILPLFVALGAGRGKPTRYQPETTYGILAMDIYVWP